MHFVLLWEPSSARTRLQVISVGLCDLIAAQTQDSHSEKTMTQSLQRCAIGVSMLFILLALNSMDLFARQHNSSNSKAWLGVSIRDVSENTSKENKSNDGTGAYVNEVTENSPADSAGIKEGDVIVQFGEKNIDDADDLVRTVRKSNIGDKVDVHFLRNGEKKSVRVVLAKYPRNTRHAFAFGDMGSRMRIMMNGENQGMQLMELNDQLGEYFGAPSGSGILVEKVRKGSAAEKAGLKAGDVLLKIGKRTIDDLEDVSKAFSKYDEGDKVDIEVLRKGVNKTLSLEVAENHEGSMFEMDRHDGPDGEMMMPRFEGNSFNIPHWGNGDFRFDFHEIGPNMEILKERLEQMSRGMRENQKGLSRNIRQYWRRSV
jgi:C-terminal processing protease CtpA/Prc